jgi:pimeloyl-ACP methyl ester carboxylesterase
MCQAVPALARRHVYIFFVNGLDPVNLGNLTGLRDYVKGLGFSQTYYGQLYNTPWFASEMRRIYAADPQARFVLVGFSLGSQMVHALAESARKAEINIDLMLYLSGNAPLSLPADRPPNVGRVILVTSGDGAVQAGLADGPAEYHLADTWHFGTPAHPFTLETLAAELLAIASRVPVMILTAPPLPPNVETAPTPRPIRKPFASRRGDQWDFLRPAVNLSQVPQLQ